MSASQFRRLFLFVYVYISISGFQLLFGQSKIDSLLNIIRKGGTDTTVINTYAGLCHEYGSERYADALKYGEYGLQLALQTNYLKGTAVCFAEMADIQYSLRNYSEAMRNITNSLKVYQLLSNKTAIADCFKMIGNIYLRQGNYLPAYKNYLISLKIYEAVNNKKGIAKCYNNFGIICLYQKNYHLALNYFKKSLKLATEASDHDNQISSLENIATIYSYQNNYPLALKYYFETLKLCKDEVNEIYPGTLINIGNIYFFEGKYVEALNYFRRSLVSFHKINDKNGIALALDCIAGLFKRTGRLDSAITYAERSLQLAEEIHSLEYIATATEILADCYYGRNDFKKAFEYHKYFKNINDSIYNIASGEQIKELIAKFENEKKEKEITLLNEKARIQQLIIEKEQTGKRNQFIIFTGLIALSMIIGGFWINRYRMKQRELMTQEKLRHKEEQLMAVIDTQEKERIRFARDVHDGIGQYFSSLKFKISNVESKCNKADLKNNNDFQDIVIHIDNLYQEIRNISFNIMPQIISMKGLVAAIEELILKINVFHNIKFSVNVYGMDERLSELIELTLYRIIQELLNNIVKYSGATKVHIQFTEHKNELNIMIEDDGHGFDTNILDHSEGHGWKNIRSRIEMIHAHIDIDSQPGITGTIIDINVPLIYQKKHD